MQNVISCELHLDSETLRTVNIIPNLRSYLIRKGRIVGILYSEIRNLLTKANYTCPVLNLNGIVRRASHATYAIAKAMWLLRKDS